jgi:hypothetical protein
MQKQKRLEFKWITKTKSYIIGFDAQIEESKEDKGVE